MAKTETKKTQSLYGVVYLDMGDTCDYRFDNLSTLFTNKEDARKEMLEDVKTYLESDNECGIKSEITEQDDDYVLVGNEERGCQWQVIEFKN